MPIGHDRELFVLAFDHRAPHLSTIFGVDGAPSPHDSARIIDAKQVIFDGFIRAIDAGAPAERAGVLVDEQFGAEAARTAVANGWIVAMPAERSGLPYFELEYGDDFATHIDAFDPTFAKILVRFNPEGDRDHNDRSLRALHRISDWLKPRQTKLMLELIVPGTPDQIEAAGGTAAYEADARPRLIRTAMETIQAAGIEADVWKIEGIDRRDDCEMVAEQSRAGEREGVGCVVLGSGADGARVDHWLRTASGVPGYLGFAIGRSIWQDPISRYLDGSLDRDAAAERIATAYLRCIDVFAG